jgi:hypothetical protein
LILRLFSNIFSIGLRHLARHARIRTPLGAQFTTFLQWPSLIKAETVCMLEFETKIERLGKGNGQTTMFVEFLGTYPSKNRNLKTRDSIHARKRPRTFNNLEELSFKVL